MTAVKRPVLKLILCGEYGVGKSSIFRRFVHDTFVEDSDRKSTLGFDHFEKVFLIDGKEITVGISLFVFPFVIYSMPRLSKLHP